MRYSSELKRLGPHFVVGLSGTSLTKAEQELLGELQPAGIILFGNNVIKDQGRQWVQPFRDLIRAARDCAARGQFITSIDHEGGKVHRFIDPVTKFPAARLWHERESVAEVATAMGRELRALDLNMSFAPVLDIDTEPKNTVISQRAFSTNPAEVAKDAEVFLRALEATGVRGCGKHFPGHGGTVADSHLELPVVTKTLDELEKLEMIPFAHLISRGVGAMMTGHILFPKIDPNLPATLSPVLVNGVLRAQMGFRGAVFSDALDMQALNKHHATAIGPALLNAGGDILLVAKALPGRGETALPLEHAGELALEMLKALDQGTLTETALKTSRERAMKFLSGLPQEPAGDVACLSCDEHQRLAASLAA